MENRSHLFNIAPKFAIFLALYHMLLFFLMNLTYVNPNYSLFLLLGILFSPFLVFLLTKKYREKYVGVPFSFNHAWMFIMMLSICCGLLFALFIYVYTQLLNPDYCEWLVVSAIKTLKESIAVAPEIYPEGSSVRTLLKMLEESPAINPITLSLQTFSSFFNLGVLGGLVVALIVRKKEKINKAINLENK